MSEASPADVVNTTDPGDETGNRFAYQWAYTGIIACALFDADTEVLEVYCEHHEDILVRHTDNRFHGIQVKTRQLGSDLWKTNDEPIRASLVRFVHLEAQFPTQFCRFTIATNHQFFEARETKDNLPHMLELARAATDATAVRSDRKLNPLLKALAEESGQDVVLVLAVLKKTDCDHELPKLDGIQTELCDCVRQAYPACGDLPYGELFRLAHELTAEVSRAANLQHAQSIPLYVNLRLDRADVDAHAIINGKRLTRERIERVIKGILDTVSLLAPADPNTQPHPLPNGNSPLRQKLNAGGLSAVTADTAMDCYAAAFKQQREWAAKLGERKALERYHHLTTLVRSEAAMAYEAQLAPTGTFGRAMLADLRQRIIDRRQRRDTPLFDSTDEHLLGYAYMLTDDCKIWWSRPFTLATPDGAGEQDNGTH